ncbi:Patatin [Paenibacillus curdlanolyticus YK9]|uniref:Patatin n=1 Tax=Paenibacillus curdlanolyticus YK9 TaxID=717606 RepID=E0ICY9_9BACL|nr:patatin family protein [Paenibacillus curdlanolyticus]EFM09444.1 Patatin [Paenibacillus curdlanolyticus YK9]
MEGVGLVLEGGGMRGVYTAGVLDYFSEQHIYFPYTVGVSAGACMAASYISRQLGRNQEINKTWVKDWRYLSWRNMWKSRQLFGMDFIFDEIPNVLVPFDNQAFMDSPEQFVVGTTDIRTGKTIYHNKTDPGFDLWKVLRASSSLPFIAPIVEYEGKALLDGGISDPIPLRQAEGDGYKRNIVVLTRNSEYRKGRNRFGWFVRRAYGKFPEFVKILLHRHKIYNDTLAYIDDQERKGNIFVIRPQRPLEVGRMERNPRKLEALHRQGYEDAKQLLASIKTWVARTR